jgi:hypothetical protein
MRPLFLFVIACFLLISPCRSTLLAPFPLEQEFNKENLVPSNVSHHSSLNKRVFIGTSKKHNDDIENSEEWLIQVPSQKRKLGDIYITEEGKHVQRPLKKKRPPKNTYSPRTKKRVTNLQKSYPLSDSKTLELHWINLALSRETNGIPKSLDEVFTSYEVKKIKIQRLPLKSLLNRIQEVKYYCSDALVPIRGSYKEGSLVFSPVKRTMFKRRDKVPCMTTKGHPRRQKKRLTSKKKLNFEISEVPQKFQFSGPRTRYKIQEEWKSYLSGSKNLQEYEEIITNSYRQYIKKTKQGYDLGQRDYPTVWEVQKKFIQHVAPHLDHIRVVYDLNTYYDVYFSPKMIFGTSDTNKRNNFQRLLCGLAPIGHDGKSMHVHHVTQRGPGDLYRTPNNQKIILFLVSEEMHSLYHGEFHFKKKLLLGTGYTPIDRSLFNTHRIDIFSEIYNSITRG